MKFITVDGEHVRFDVALDIAAMLNNMGQRNRPTDGGGMKMEKALNGKTGRRRRMRGERRERERERESGGGPREREGRAAEIRQRGRREEGE